MKMQTVAVLGAGAVGSYVIWGLAGKPGIRLEVLAEGERAARLKANGIGINGRTYRPEVWAPEEAHGVDFLVVCLKYGALPGAMDSIRKAVGEHTVVMSLMNGVDSEERIAAEVGDAHVIRSLIKVASHKEADGFHFDPDATLGIIFGEQEAPFQSERVQAIVELFEGSGIHYRVTKHIREEMWAKFRLNVCNNLPQAILGAGVGCSTGTAYTCRPSATVCAGSWKPLQRPKASTCASPMPLPGGAVPCRLRPATPHCRIWTPDATPRSTCSPVP